MSLYPTRAALFSAFLDVDDFEDAVDFLVELDVLNDLPPQSPGLRGKMKRMQKAALLLKTTLQSLGLMGPAGAVFLSPPENLSAELSGQSIELTWDVAQNGYVSHYELHRSTTPGFDIGPSTLLVENILNTSWVDSDNLEPDETYYYQVQAFNTRGQETGSDGEVSIAYACPNTPADFAGGNSGTTNSLSWTLNTEPDFTHVEVYRSTTTGFTPSSENFIGTSNVDEYTDAELDTTTYSHFYYRLIAVNEAGRKSAPTAELDVEVI